MVIYQLGMGDMAKKQTNNFFFDLLHNFDLITVCASVCIISLWRSYNHMHLILFNFTVKILRNVKEQNALNCFLSLNKIPYIMNTIKYQMLLLKTDSFFGSQIVQP